MVANSANMTPEREISCPVGRLLFDQRYVGTPSIYLLELH